MYDILIVGGGIVGLATALKLKEQRPELKVVLVEKEDKLTAHQTGNNSGVIHSGLYYKPGSLKATNCLRGYQMLLDFCNAEGVPYELCGKIVVATLPEELPCSRICTSVACKTALPASKKSRGAVSKNSSRTAMVSKPW